MVTVFESIKTALIRLLKDLYPAFDVLGEEIHRTRGEDDKPDMEDFIFLDIIPATNETRGPHHTDRRVLVDAALHCKSERNADYLRMSGELDGALRPVFRFEDGDEKRAITIPVLEFRVVDKVLHCTFTIAFTDSCQEPEALPFMEELESSINNTERA